MHILKLKPLSFGSHKLSYHQLLRHNLKNYADAFQVSELSHILLIFKNCHSLEMVFCYKNCSDLLCEKNVLVIENKFLKFESKGRECAKTLRSL